MPRERLWQQVYQAIRQAAEGFSRASPGPGHPDLYPTWIILIYWFWACLWREPVSRALAGVASPRRRRLWRQLGFALPEAVPHGATVSRRLRRADYPALVQRVHQQLLDRLLAPASCRILLIDSSPLDIPTISHDPEARFGHHGHFGYRFHTLMTQDRLILEQETWGTHVQELAVLPHLVDRAARRGVRCRYLAADVGYDSEPAHRRTLQQLGGQLVAPPNDRGGRRTMLRTPLRRAMWQAWNSRPLREARRCRAGIERAYSLLKGPLATDSLPRHIRGLRRVRAFLEAQTLFYHGYRLAQQQALANRP